MSAVRRWNKLSYCMDSKLTQFVIVSDHRLAGMSESHNEGTATHTAIQRVLMGQ